MQWSGPAMFPRLAPKSPRSAARSAASRNWALISGGARGVDQLSMQAAHEAGASVVGGPRRRYHTPTPPNQRFDARSKRDVPASARRTSQTRASGSATRWAATSSSTQPPTSHSSLPPTTSPAAPKPARPRRSEGVLAASLSGEVRVKDQEMPHSRVAARCPSPESMSSSTSTSRRPRPWHRRRRRNLEPIKWVLNWAEELGRPRRRRASSCIRVPRTTRLDTEKRIVNSVGAGILVWLPGRSRQEHPRRRRAESPATRPSLHDPRPVRTPASPLVAGMTEFSEPKAWRRGQPRPGASLARGTPARTDTLSTRPTKKHPITVSCSIRTRSGTPLIPCTVFPKEPTAFLQIVDVDKWQS